jgi:Cdc6-like AAA superfamily ATPase
VPDHCPSSLEWFLNEKDYQRWKESNESCIFSIKGSPAQGKSVLAKFIAQDLEASSTSKIKVFYFACLGHGGPGFDTVETITKSLCVQLFQLLVDAVSQGGSVPDVKFSADLLVKLQKLPSPEIFRDSSWRMGLQLFKDLIELVLASDIYVVLDGLDECKRSGNDRRELLVELAAMASSMGTNRKRTKLFTTIQPGEDDIETALKEATFEMVLKARQSDIALVIQSKVVSNSPYRTIKCQEFMRRNQYHIIRKLSNKAGNTYVWIRSIFWMLDLEKFPDLEWFDSLVEQLSPQLTTMYKDLVARIFEDDFST